MEEEAVEDSLDHSESVSNKSTNASSEGDVLQDSSFPQMENQEAEGDLSAHEDPEILNKQDSGLDEDGSSAETLKTPHSDTEQDDRGSPTQKEKDSSSTSLPSSAASKSSPKLQERGDPKLGPKLQDSLEGRDLKHWPKLQDSLEEKDQQHGPKLQHSLEGSDQDSASSDKPVAESGEGDVTPRLRRRRKPNAGPRQRKAAEHEASPLVENNNASEDDQSDSTPPPANVPEGSNVPGDVPPNQGSSRCCLYLMMLVMLMLLAVVVAAVGLAYAYDVDWTESLPAFPAKVDELSVWELNEYKSRPQLRILAVGKRGIGKRTVITELFGEGQECSNNTKASSSSTMCDTFKINGVSIQVLIMDSPHVRTDLLQKIDLVVFMTRLDDAHFRTEDEEILEALSRKSGSSLWKKGMSVLTFANRVTYVDSDTGMEQQTKEHLRNKARDWESKIHKTLKTVGVSKSVLSDMPTVPVGHPSKVQLFDDMESWKTSLIKCMLVRLRASGMEASAAMWRVMKDNIQLQKDKSTIECESLIAAT